MLSCLEYVYIQDALEEINVVLARKKGIYRKSLKEIYVVRGCTFEEPNDKERT